MYWNDDITSIYAKPEELDILRRSNIQTNNLEALVRYYKKKSEDLEEEIQQIRHCKCKDTKD